MFTIQNMEIFRLSGDSRSLISRSLFILLLFYTILVTAWIGDDAQITFRQIWNFVSGDGITFNFGERVHAFTHPLWFFVLSLVTLFTRELFVTTIIISILCSIFAVLILLNLEYKYKKSGYTYFSPLFLLLFSWAFVDFSTSGLENALSYFLFANLIYFLRTSNQNEPIQPIFVIISLLVLNRIDYALILLPLTLYLIYRMQSIQNFVKSARLGILILVFWILFSTFYFGSPLPNTYFAKFATGSNIVETLGKGLNYFISLNKDLITAVIIIAGIVISYLSRNMILICLSVGQILYLLYIFWIGGDFMLGRFFSVIAFLSIGQIIFAFTDSRFSKRLREYFSISVFVAAIIFGIFNNYPIRWHFFQGLEFRQLEDGIYDERAIYSTMLGLFSYSRNGLWPKIKTLSEDPPQNYNVVCPFLGSISVENQSNHLIDVCGLSDPFLARIPAYRDKNWSIGHNYRKIPTDYGEYLIGNKDRIDDENLMALLSDVTLVSRADLFDLKRIGAIWRLHTGYHNSKIDMTAYTDTQTYIPASNRTEVIKVENWNDEFDRKSPAYIYKFFAHNEPIRNFINSVEIKSQTGIRSSEIELILDGNHVYEIYVNGMLAEDVAVITNLDMNEVEYDNKYIVKLESKIFVKEIEIQEIGIKYSNIPWRDFQYIKSIAIK